MKPSLMKRGMEQSWSRTATTSKIPLNTVLFGLCGTFECMFWGYTFSWVMKWILASGCQRELKVLSEPSHGQGRKRRYSLSSSFPLNPLSLALKLKALGSGPLMAEKLSIAETAWGWRFRPTLCPGWFSTVAMVTGLQTFASKPVWIYYILIGNILIWWFIPGFCDKVVLRHHLWYQRILLCIWSIVD